MNIDKLASRLVSWAQNEEMIDEHFLQHGKDCNDAARLLQHMQINEDKIVEQTKEIERLRADRDRFQAIVHAVSPYLDPACLGLTPERAKEVLKDACNAIAELTNERDEAREKVEQLKAHYEERLERQIATIADKVNRIHVALDWLAPWTAPDMTHPAKLAVKKAVEALTGGREK